MHKRLLQILALAVCLGLLPAAAYAKGGKGGGPPADKGKSSGGHEKDKHHGDNDRDDDHAGRGHGREHESAAGPSSRQRGWDQGKKTGWGDCNVPPGLAKQRGCDSSGFSARERSAHRNQTAATRSATTSSNKAAQSGQSRGIILQRSGQSTTRTTTATTASAPKATQAGQSRGIILQRNATKPAAQNKAATVQK